MANELTKRDIAKEVAEIERRITALDATLWRDEQHATITVLLPALDVRISKPDKGCVELTFRIGT